MLTYRKDHHSVQDAMRVLAVIPAYNEEEALAGTVNGLIAACPDVDYLVINDGSSDDTERVCLENGFHHLRMPINTGLTSVFRTGMKYALRHGYDAVVQFDADGQHDPNYIDLMAQEMASSNADIVIASRGAAGGGAVGARGIGAKLITALIRTATHQVISDPTSGMRLYGRSMVEKFARDFDIAPEPDTISLLIRKGAKVVEVPAEMRERQGGTSYLRFMSSIRYMLRTCISLLLFQWFR
jgi:glycosyltransferase involved in cell wall biosynthesis